MKVRLCHYAGCRDLAIPHSTYCKKHKELSMARRELYIKSHPMFSNTNGDMHQASGEYNNLYRTYRWRCERKDFLMEHPYCYVCGNKAVLVDHIRPHRGDMELFWDHNNWQPMCNSCHTQKTLRENKYFKHRYDR